jgi:serine phosphatase RsbU (regulator of sigma subunit)
MNEPGRTVYATHATVAEAMALHDELRSYLVVIAQGQAGARYEVGLDPLTVGRDETRHIVIGDAQVSRLHLQVTLVGGEVVVEDLGSSNGTFLDGQRIQGPTVLPAEASVRVGSHLLRHERRSRREVEQEAELQRELERARSYVQSLLPAPWKDGAMRVDWHYCPSTQLGGDIFSYADVDAEHKGVCLIDVAGHGVGPAMYSVSVLNVLRQRALPGVDFTDPAQILQGLNTMFPMEDHDGLFFTTWVGIYSPRTRRLRFASAGHHPAWLFAPGAAPQPLRTHGPIIGAMPNSDYAVHEVPVAPGSVLYLFSDGAFEVTAPDGHQCGIDELLPLLGAAESGTSGEAERIFHAVKQRSRPGPLDDDFSLLVMGFP